MPLPWDGHPMFVNGATATKCTASLCRPLPPALTVLLCRPVHRRLPAIVQPSPALMSSLALCPLPAAIRWSPRPCPLSLRSAERVAVVAVVLQQLAIQQADLASWRKPRSAPTASRTRLRRIPPTACPQRHSQTQSQALVHRSLTLKHMA
ncbi:hypothetical protein BC831DRAFT_286234 [Entophlyctis helioformis]|nr:hypothetical protein BC831DRAFT_286234 [Entophlyctis helioformis]